MQRQIAIRLVLGLFGIAALFSGYWWFTRATQDMGGAGKAETTGMIAAVEYADGASRVVVFNAQGGKSTVTPGPVGTEDRDPVWRPDGHRLFFASNREGGTFQIYRWNPANGAVERRSIGSRGVAEMSFGPAGFPNLNDSALVAVQGLVFDFNQRTQEMWQVLPPVTRETPVESGDGGGSVSLLEGAYARIGGIKVESIVSAKWGADRSVIFAVLRREGDEVFVVQPMGGDRPAPLIPLAAGRRLQFDVAADGTAVLAIQDFAFPDKAQIPPEMIKNGKIQMPWRHGLLRVWRDAGRGWIPEPIVISPDDQVAFGDPSCDPTGPRVALVVGPVDEQGNLQGRDLAVMPIEQGGGTRALPLLRGRVAEPSWSPDGSKLVFLKGEPGGGMAVFTVAAQGGGEARISDAGDFARPVFSPQRPTSP